MRTRRINVAERRWRTSRIAAGALIVLGAAVWTGPELAGAAPKDDERREQAGTVEKDEKTKKPDDPNWGEKPDKPEDPNWGETGGKPSDNGDGGSGSTTGGGGSATSGGGSTTGGGGGGSQGGGGSGAPAPPPSPAPAPTANSGGGAAAPRQSAPAPPPSAPTAPSSTGSGTSDSRGGSTSSAKKGGGGLGGRVGSGSPTKSVTVPAAPGDDAIAALRGPDTAAQAAVRGLQSAQGMPTAGGANLYAQLAAAPLPPAGDDRIPSNPYIVFVILSLFGVGVALTGRIRTPLPVAAVRRGHAMPAGF